MTITINHDARVVDICYKDKPPTKEFAWKFSVFGRGFDATVYLVRVYKEGAELCDYVLDAAAW